MKKIIKFFHPNLVLVLIIFTILFSLCGFVGALIVLGYIAFIFLWTYLFGRAFGKYSKWRDSIIK